MVEQVAASAVEASQESALADLELTLLLEAILRFSGRDFSGYAQGVLKRRVAERVRAENVQTISGLQERILHDPDALARFVLAMSGGSGQLFYDEEFFAAFRTRVVPFLRTYTFTRIWVPKCARGEDAYSLAVILQQEGMLDRAMIYATDPSELAIAAARAGVFEFEAGNAPEALAEYGEIGERTVVFGEHLKRHIIFAKHSLVTDGSLNEFHVIVARSVLRQFNSALQFRVHNLFLNSLTRLGFLCLGSNENLRTTPHERVFLQVAGGVPIYRRMR